MHAKDKWIDITFDKVFIAKSNEDLANNPDLSGYKMVICDFEGNTEFADLTKLPKKMIIKGSIEWKLKDLKNYQIYQILLVMVNLTVVIATI